MLRLTEADRLTVSLDNDTDGFGVHRDATVDRTIIQDADYYDNGVLIGLDTPFSRNYGSTVLLWIPHEDYGSLDRCAFSATTVLKHVNMSRGVYWYRLTQLKGYTRKTIAKKSTSRWAAWGDRERE